jgi:hypothetical protein
LQRWWRTLFPDARGAAPPAPDDGRRSGAGGGDGVRVESARTPARRRYAAPLPDGDTRREAHLGAVLQALAGGPLRRDELERRVGATEWGAGRLDAVVDHGLATHVLVEDDGVVRARYAD